MQFFNNLVFTTTICILLVGCYSSFADARKPSFLTTKSIISIRGGDLGPVKSKSLSQIFTVLPTLDAVACTFAPVATLSKAGIEIEKGSIDEFLAQAAGAHAAGVALTHYLATTGKTSIYEAVGYGLLTRLILGMRIFATHLDLVKNYNPFVVFIAASVISTCTYSLISGELDPKLCLTFVASFLALAGFTVFTSPELLPAKALEIDINESKLYHLLLV